MFSALWSGLFVAVWFIIANNVAMPSNFVYEGAVSEEVVYVCSHQFKYKFGFVVHRDSIFECDACQAQCIAVNNSHSNRAKVLRVTNKHIEEKPF